MVVAEASPNDRRVPGIRRYWTSFLRFAGAELNARSETFWIDWPVFLTISLASAVVVVGSLQILESYSLGGATENVVLESFALVPASALALLLIALLGLAYWQVRKNPRIFEGRGSDPAEGELPPRYVVALLALAFAIGVSIVAFAGITTLHLQERGESSHFWATEQAYIWHVLDAFPFLGIPATLGWDEPAVGSDHMTGVVILVFEIAVILPVLRLAIAGYNSLANRVDDQRRERMQERDRGLRSHRFDFVILLELRQLIVATVVLGLGVVGTYVLWIFLFDPLRWPTRSLASVIPADPQVRGVRVPIGWTATIPQWLAVASIICALYYLVSEGVRYFEPRRHSLGIVVVACAAYAAILILITEAAVALVLALTHVGAISNAENPPHDQVASAFSFVVRPAVDAIPGLEIPTTLNWNDEGRFVGIAGGVVVLAYKFAFFALLLFPVAALIRRYGRQSAVASPHESPLAAATGYSDGFLMAQNALDAAQHEAIQMRTSRRQPGPTRTATSRPPLVLPSSAVRGTGFLWEPSNRYRRDAFDPARKSVRQLLKLIDEVKALFGAGPVSERAEDLLQQTARRLTLIEDAYPEPFSGRLRDPDHKAVLASLVAARRDSASAASAYATAAGQALRASIPARPRRGRERTASKTSDEK